MVLKRLLLECFRRSVIAIGSLGLAVCWLLAAGCRVCIPGSNLMRILLADFAALYEQTCQCLTNASQARRLRL